MYLDVHAHFAGEGYPFPETWEHIMASGVEQVILAGDSLEHSLWHRDFAREHAGAWFTAGVHPSACDAFDGDVLAKIEHLLSDEKCVAVGEVGLDYHWPTPDRQVQRRAFCDQLALAVRTGLPVQIHARECCQDVLAILREYAPHLGGMLLHCYSFGAANLDNFLALGTHCSFGGVTCFKNAKNVWESVVACPVDRILSETDSPYLSPFRGEKNTPANIPVIVRRMAELKGMEEGELAAAIRRNAHALFPKLHAN